MPAGLVSGRLEGIRIPDLLWALCRKSKTGTLTVSRWPFRKTLYFEEGRIVFAASTDPEDRLGEMFLRQGRIRLDHLEAALAQLHTGKRIGTLLVEAGSLTAEELVEGVLEQVQSVVLDTFTWQEGEYRFEEGPLPTDEVITLRMKTSQLLLRGIHRIRSFGAIRTSVGPPRTTYALADGWRDTIEALDLHDGEELLIGRLERGAETVENLCREVFLSNFEIYQTLWGFKVLGIIEEREAGIRKSVEASHEGSLREQGLADALIRLCRDGETGVLHVHRRSQERTFHIDEGHCVFATSSEIDDGLVSYLLQRGVISLRDREETAKRLLSNKRVGTILRELGVIDDRDLGDMVRQQLSNIVYDTFRWEEGDYAFLPGSLPSIEEITLDVTIETLLAEGLRRVTSWSRVREGCGDLESGLELTPSFLDVLDAMSAGPQEWQVVTLLKTPRTPKQICREAELSDFRVCQILWTLRVLGAVVPAELEVAETVAVDTSRAEPAEPVRIDIEEVEDEPVEVHREETPEPVSVEEASAPDDEPEPLGVAPESDEAREDREAPAQQDEDVAAVAAYDEERSAAPVEREHEDERQLSAAHEEVEAAEEEPWRAEPVESASESSYEEPESAVEAGAAAEPDDETPLEVRRIEIDREPDVTWGLDRSFDLDGEQPAEAPGEAFDREDHEEPEPDLDEAAGAEVDAEREAAVSAEATQDISRELVDEAPRDSREPVDEGLLEPAETPGRSGNGETEVLPHEIDEASATQKLSREEVERALSRAAADDEEPAPDATTSETSYDEIVGNDAPPREPDWEPPDDLERAIARFNAMQRLVFRAIRAEVGAGASNFIRACCDQLGEELADPLQSAELLADGSWDAEGLRRAVVTHRIRDPWIEYQRLIELEIDLLRDHIGEAKVLDLQRQIDKLDRPGAA
jgi:hypothetical protein